MNARPPDSLRPPRPLACVRAFGARVWYSFPVQLFGLQMRQNHLLLALWALLVLFISDRLASKFGIKYLFLEPEYGGEVGGAAFFLVGVGLGGLIMTWNLTTYLLNARYFPFLATLQRPFGKYCINNVLLPLAFFGFYVLRLRAFLKSELNYGGGQLFATVMALLAGIVTVVLAYVFYFRFTNKDIASYPDLRRLLMGQRSRRRRRILSGYRGQNIARLVSGERAWRVDNYLTERLRTRRTRSIKHYRPEQILGVFRQNHLNALLLQGGILLLLLAAGLIADYTPARIPAGASIFILLSVVAAVAGAITYWFHAWRTSIFLLIVLALNVVTGQDWFTFRNRAYGLDYTGELPTYNYAALEALAAPKAVAADRDSMRQVLERWRARTGEDKPEMVLLCVSGGGLKATYWTTHVMQELQRETEGEFMRHTAMISGASGGMIGAAYVRELEMLALRSEVGLSPKPVLTAERGFRPPAWRSKDGAERQASQERQAGGLNPCSQDSAALEAIGGDLLNAVAFAIVSQDLFLPSPSFTYDGVEYRKDRAYAFEEELHRNSGDLFRKRLSEYEALERSGAIPMLLLTPSIVNDARRLIISPLGVRHLTLPPAGVGRGDDFEVDAVDFGAFFAEQDAHRLSLGTALRMNATYPYVLPNVYLPSAPPVEVMDAGFRDNFGVMEASRFLQVYREWILDNTSGVTMVQVSTLEKFEDSTIEREPRGWIASLFSPLGVAGQLISLQDFQLDDNVGLLHELFGEDHFDFLRFSYQPAEDRDAASMTFHLTEGEKKDIRASIEREGNVRAMGRVRESLRAGK